MRKVLFGFILLAGAQSPCFAQDQMDKKLEEEANLLVSEVYEPLHTLAEFFVSEASPTMMDQSVGRFQKRVERLLEKEEIEVGQAILTTALVRLFKTPIGSTLKKDEVKLLELERLLEETVYTAAKAKKRKFVFVRGLVLGVATGAGAAYLTGVWARVKGSSVGLKKKQVVFYLLAGGFSGSAGASLLLSDPSMEERFRIEIPELSDEEKLLNLQAKETSYKDL